MHPTLNVVARHAAWPWAQRAALWLAIALPAAYFVAVTQYSAITYPFWDHVELARYIVSWRDGTFRFSDLFQPHNHTRPFTYRAIYVANAALTNWDLRSEYVYMIAVGLGTWAVHLAFTWRLVGRDHGLRALAVAAIVSILVFSPVGHNNHWWSMMLQLTLANLLMVACITQLAFAGDAWRRHALAALFAWLASYTLTNGLFVLFVAAVVMQLSGRDLRKPDRFAIFWLANLVVLLFLYLHGMPKGPATPTPGPLELAVFALSYVGSPLASLLYFPFQSLFDIPKSMGWTATVGVLVLLLAADALQSAWQGLRRREPRAVVLFLFVGVGVVSACATAWARASFDALGVANANASRYTLFSAYILFGLVYYHASGPAPSSVLRALAARARIDNWGVAAMAALLLVSLWTYRSAIPIYGEARQFNQNLANAFNARGEVTPFDKNVYPNDEMVTRVRGQLMHWGLGPYRFRAQAVTRLGSMKLAEAVPITPGGSYSQRFRLARPGLLGVTFQVVTWGKKPSSYPLEWTLVSTAGGHTLARGRIDAATLHDWAPIAVALDAAAPSDAAEFELTVSSPPGPAVAAPVGLPLFHPEPGGPASALVTAEGSRGRAPLGLDVRLPGG
ncbi:MAG TPA: hypothetical protein VEC19_10650 [Usitatibacter sp.]|nr:hypothetical protein [Usitatibacter sp.]